jgi:PAS domain S-box-containing protein
MMTHIKVLVLEDMPTDAELMIHELKRAGFDPEWWRVDTEQDYLASLDVPLDIILSDYSLPQFDALKALQYLLDRQLDIPFIIVSGAITEEVAVECMKQGAADYLIKDRLARLGQAVTRALEQKRLREERRCAEARVRHLNDVLRAIRDVDQVILREQDQDRLLTETCKILVRTRGYRMVWIGMIEEGHKRVIPRACAGYGTDYLDDIIITWDETETGKGPTGTAIRTGKTNVFRNILESSRAMPWRKGALKRGFASSAAAPIVYGGRMFGALNVYATLPDAFDEEELSLLKELAWDLAFALKSIEEEAKRKKAEEALQESERRYRELANTLPQTVFETDDQGTILFANLNMLSAFGFDQADISAGLSINKILLPNDSDKGQEHFGMALNGRIMEWECMGRRKDGGTFPINIYCSLIFREGNPTGIRGIAVDITEQKRMEEELRRRDRLLTGVASAASYLLTALEYEDALNEALEIIGLVTNVDRVYIFEKHDSDKGEHLMSQRFEWTREGIKPQVGNSAFQNIPFDAYFPGAYEALAAGRHISGITQQLSDEARALLRDREAVSMLMVPITIKDALWGFIGFDDCHFERSWDDTEISIILRVAAASIGGAIARYEAEISLKRYSERLEDMVKEKTQKLKDAERLVAIGETAAMVGHDLRNPLQVVVNLIYLARLKMESLPPQKRDFAEKASIEETLKTILDMSEYMNKIVLDLQDFARPLQPDLIDVNLLVLVKDTLSSIATPEQTDVTLEIDEDITAMADPNLIKRVFTNLILNAVQAMPDGGKLMIKAQRDGDYISISIQDTGEGIPKEMMPRLFQPLSTGKPKGTGLGLAVSKRLVEAHNGNISIESEVGMGTKVTVRLPSVHSVLL